MDNDISRAKVWRCENCGAVVDGNYDICMRCGNIRPQDAQETDDLPEIGEQTEAAPEVPESSAGGEKPPKKKKRFLKFLLSVLIITAAAAVLLFYFSKKTHEKVVELYEAGDYSAAISESQKDLFFSDEIRIEAIKKHALQTLSGEEALEFLHSYSYEPGIQELFEQTLSEQIENGREQGEYKYVLEIIDKYSPQPETDERLEPTLLAYVEYLCQEKRFRSAVDLVEDYSAVLDAAEMTGKISVREAEYYVEQGKYDKALEIIDGLDPEKHDLKAMYNVIYMDMATKSLRREDATAAKEQLEMVSDVRLAEDYLKAFELMEKGQLYEAAKLLRETESDRDAVSMETWIKIINDYPPASEDSFEAAFVRGNVEAALLGKPLDFDLDEPGSMSYDMPRRQVLSDGYSVTKDTLALCTGKDTGKMLVMWEITGYVSHDVDYYIAWDIMKYLPEEYYPAGPEEAEYIVKIACTASSEGWYNIDGETVPAVKEKVTVSCTRPSNVNVTLHGTKSIYGDSAPSYISVYSIPDFISGGMPDEDELSQLIFNAMKDISGK